MKAQIVMVIDGNEYVYGTYPFETVKDKNKVNELAIKIRDEREVGTFVREV